MITVRFGRHSYDVDDVNTVAEAAEVAAAELPGIPAASERSFSANGSAISGGAAVEDGDQITVIAKPATKG